MANNIDTRAVLDILERTGWTALQAAAGFLAAVQTDNVYLGILTAAVAALLKSLVATKFGNGTASTLPAKVEPEYQEPFQVSDLELSDEDNPEAAEEVVDPLLVDEEILPEEPTDG